MVNSETKKVIDNTIDMMTKEHNGDMLLIPNMPEIARRAEVSMETLKEYLADRLGLSK